VQQPEEGGGKEKEKGIGERNTSHPSPYGGKVLGRGKRGMGGLLLLPTTLTPVLYGEGGGGKKKNVFAFFRQAEGRPREGGKKNQENRRRPVPFFRRCAGKKRSGEERGKNPSKNDIINPDGGKRPGEGKGEKKKKNLHFCTWGRGVTCCLKGQRRTKAAFSLPERLGFPGRGGKGKGKKNNRGGKKWSVCSEDADIFSLLMFLVSLGEERKKRGRKPREKTRTANPLGEFSTFDPKGVVGGVRGKGKKSKPPEEDCSSR